MIPFAAVISFLFITTCFFPQGLFGAMVACRRSRPLHTDECGFPMGGK